MLACGTHPVTKGKDLLLSLHRLLELKLRAAEVLEVERLELDHFWEIHRQQLEQSDQDTGETSSSAPHGPDRLVLEGDSYAARAAPAQKCTHPRAAAAALQREAGEDARKLTCNIQSLGGPRSLSKMGPGHVFLLGSTLAESSPQRGPLRVMQAWAPWKLCSNISHVTGS